MKNFFTKKNIHMGSTTTTSNSSSKKLIHPYDSLMLNHNIIDHNYDPPNCNMNLSVGCKRLRQLAPKLAEPMTSNNNNLDLMKSFISAASRNSASINCQQQLVQGAAGGGGGTSSRWNPTREQIGILEMLYRGGMRTPNAHQIEHITLQLGKYGKIEGKNVFYWFQNHKARERQKQKRNTASAASTAYNSTTSRSDHHQLEEEEEESADIATTAPYKIRKCSTTTTASWVFLDQIINNNAERSAVARTTLDLFPLHPEGRS